MLDPCLRGNAKEAYLNFRVRRRMLKVHSGMPRVEDVLVTAPACTRLLCIIYEHQRL